MIMETISTVLIVIAFAATVIGPVIGALEERKLSREHREWLKELDDYYEEES